MDDVEMNDDFCGVEEQSDDEDNKKVKHLQFPTLDDLTFALEPSEFGYFNPRLVNMWAGPDHWRVKPISKTNEKKERTKKTVISHKFNTEADELLKQFVKSRARTTLRKETLKSNKSRDSNTLPFDIRYRESDLRKLSVMPIWGGKLEPTPALRSQSTQENDNTW